MTTTAQENCNQLKLLESAVSVLNDGARRLTSISHGELAVLLDRCAANVLHVSPFWVETACSAKKIDANEPVAAEEILAGPASFLRYMRLLATSLRQTEQQGKPAPPGKPRTNSCGQVCIPVLPVQSLYDRLIFMGMKAEIWLANSANSTPINTQQSTDDAHAVTAETPGIVAGVLGAGNVSSIPATDTLYKIFHDRQAVLLKLNPVNDYLEPIFQKIFAPLVNAGFLRIVRGDSEIGSALVNHDSIGTVHITGSHLTHDAIVWGTSEQERAARRRDNAPLLNKPITSELGNVTPWIVVPGNYSPQQLEAQAQHIVASITNNASFNCLATKMLVTSRAWPQRKQFLDRIEEILASIPTRYAYYPGAEQRFAAATGKSPDKSNGHLPWTLIRDADPTKQPNLFVEESFVCVCGETNLDSADPVRFLEQAVDFANESLFGTLCVSLTVPNDFRKSRIQQLETAIGNLKYGTVCVNQWSGVAYGIMSPPWGGHPSATLKNTESGLGHVHNTFAIEDFDKSVLWGPLRNWPKPVWFPTHRRSHLAAWALAEFYDRPSWIRLPKLFFHALLG